ncbi:hypothetical protein SLA2020_347070, partial [Shorea laevis]
TSIEEITKLKAKEKTLLLTQRHLLGEDLGGLCVKELQNLEKQHERALAFARQRKERQLGDLNKHFPFQLNAEGHSFKTIQGL